MGCHEKHANSHNPNGLIIKANIFFCILVDPMNNLASIRHCHRGKGRSNYPQAPSSWPLLTFFFPINDFPVIFRDFINIHEYANEMIFI